MELALSAIPAYLRRVLDCAFPPEDPDELAAVLPIIKAACPRPEYLPWAELHKRTYGLDLLARPCSGPRRVVAFVSDRKRTGELPLPGIWSEPPGIALAS